MRIFISVASPDRPKAEETALALRGDGHVVFLDDHDLPVADTYHERIRAAIEQADIFIFFISPASVQPKRYTLSELKFAQIKWPHPRDRLIPVMAAPTDMNSIPPYLRAVSICFPRGSLAAEVAYEVSRLEKRLRRGFTLLPVAPTGSSQGVRGLVTGLLPTILLFMTLGAVAGLVNVSVTGGMGPGGQDMERELVRGLIFATVVVFALIYFELGTVRTLAVGLLATMAAFVAADFLPEDTDMLRATTGAARAAVLMLGLCAVIRELHEHWRWAIVTVAGAIGGLILWDSKDVGVWEMSVAAALCYALTGVASARAHGWSPSAGAIGRRASAPGRNAST